MLFPFYRGRNWFLLSECQEFVQLVSSPKVSARPTQHLAAKEKRKVQLLAISLLKCSTCLRRKRTEERPSDLWLVLEDPELTTRSPEADLDPVFHTLFVYYLSPCLKTPASSQIPVGFPCCQCPPALLFIVMCMWQVSAPSHLSQLPCSDFTKGSMCLRYPCFSITAPGNPQRGESACWHLCGENK